MNVLEIKDLTVAYGNVTAVKNVSLNIEKGSLTCLIGSNGSGKSSMIKAIMGLIPSYQGSIKSALDNSKIAYLPQTDFITKDFPATVYEVVLSGRQKNHGNLFYSSDDKAKAKEAMELFRITNLSQKRIGELSGGQRQRVLLARAMSKEPEMLILDEPCSGLDPVITAELYKLLSELNGKKGITVLMSTHDLDQVERYATNVIVMNQKLELCGSLNDWIADRHKDCIRRKA